MYTLPFNQKAFKPGAGIDVPLNDAGQTALHLAVIEGDFEEARRMIRGGARVNAQDKSGRTPLFYAAKEADPKTLSLLLNNGATFRVLDKEGRTPLLHALQSRASVAQLERLLACGATLDFPSAEGRTIVHFAAQDKRADLIPWLLEKGISLRRRDDSGMTAAHVAVQERDMDFLTALHKADGGLNAKDDDLETPLHHAAQAGDDGMVAFLLKSADVRRGVNASSSMSDGYTPLLAAVSGDHMQCARLLMAAGADPNVVDHRGRHSLFIAAENGNAEMVRFLAENGADVSKAPVLVRDGATVLHRTSQKSFERIAPILFRHGASLNVTDANGQTPLHRAASILDEDRMDILIKAGANVEICDKEGMRPLDVVSQHAQYRVGLSAVMFLLQAGASPDMSSDPAANLAPLHYATVGGSLDVIQLLLQKGADVDARTRTRQKLSALHIAVMQGNHSAMRMLLRAGADINAKDAQGKTALHHAVTQHRTDMFMSLSRYPGIYASARDNEGRLPLHHAVIYDHGAVASVLLRAGNDPYATDNYGYTSMHYAATRSVEMLKRINDAAPISRKGGWDMATSRTGETLLHIAARTGARETIVWLAEQGANPFLRDNEGRTPLDKALMHGHDRAAEILERVMAQQKKPPAFKPPAP
ncbi:MAG: ankyrin repeat domain-containing protein [Alphaproteobacteria bacterium]|nr:ankyrin repeat domain-containing protein [Alphaproteobacteria bacterium]